MREVKRHQGQQFRRFQDDDGNFHVECRKCKEIKPHGLSLEQINSLDDKEEK